MIKRILNNWNWKVLSLAVAFTLWLIVMNYEDPFVTRTFRNVPVSKLNESAITSLRKAIDYRSGEVVDLVLEGPRSVMDRFSLTDIYAYADLSKVSVTNAVDIEISLNEKVSIKEQNPLKMEIDLENIITVQKEIQPYYDGELAGGFVRLEPSIVPNAIQITGPESKVARVSKVFASVDVEGATNDVSVYTSPLLVDENNEEVQGVSVGNAQVEIYVPVQRLKTIALSEDIPRTPAPGYGIDEVALDKMSILVRGEDRQLDLINNIVIEGLDLSGYTESTEIQVPLDVYLPEGVHVYSGDAVATIRLEVAPLVRKTIDFALDDIEVVRVPDGMEYSFISEADTVVSLTLEGTARKLEDFDAESVGLVLSLENRRPGTYNLPLAIKLPSSVPIVEEAGTVAVRIAAVEE